MNILELENVSKRIKGKKILKDLSFNIPKGSITGFIGDNGAGKTTTIKLIFSELRLDSGHIFYNKQNINSNNYLKEFSFFPDSNNIPLNLTVKEYLFYIMDLLKIENKESKYNILLDLFNFKEQQNKKIKELSAGQKKKATMIACLISNPKIIILDEPTANLDIKSKLEFIEILKKLNKKGITIMITSHMIEELEGLINHLVLIDKGEILYCNKFDNKKESIKQIYTSYVQHEKINVNFIEKVF